jgi:TetR/AcrR family transcriptional regulator, transcriptional repressor for nem operon
MGRTSDAKMKLMEVIVELIWTGSYGSTTIDDICEKAQVKRGSFYYFFESKADLAVAAIEEEWRKHRPELDAIFSPVVPPLERLRKYCEYGYKIQAEWKEKCGHVLGCALFALGSEIGTQPQEARLTKKVQEILDQKRKYLESAIRDAQAAELIHVTDPAAKARTLFTYHEGQMTEARIQNNLDLLRDSVQGTFDLLGVRESTLAK